VREADRKREEGERKDKKKGDTVLFVFVFITSNKRKGALPFLFKCTVKSLQTASIFIERITVT